MVDFDFNVLIGENRNVCRYYAEQHKRVLADLQAMFGKGFNTEKILHGLSLFLLFVEALQLLALRLQIFLFLFGHLSSSLFPDKFLLCEHKILCRIFDKIQNRCI